MNRHQVFLGSEGLFRFALLRLQGAAYRFHARARPELSTQAIPDEMHSSDMNASNSYSFQAEEIFKVTQTEIDIVCVLCSSYLGHSLPEINQALDIIEIVSTEINWAPACSRLNE